MTVDVNIKNVKSFVKSDKFRDFLLSNTTDFGTACFVLETLLNAIDAFENE